MEEDANSFFSMDSYERRKKSDKAKDKSGQPSQKHVRMYEARMEKRKQELAASLPQRH